MLPTWRPSRRTGRAVLGGLVLLLLAVGAGAVVVLTRGPACPVDVTTTSSGGSELVPLDELAPEGTVGEERRPELEAIGALGGPFGDVVAGRFYPEGSAVPTVVPLESSEDGVEDRIVLAATGPDGGTFRAVGLPGGSLRWGASYDGSAVGGGLVGDDFVVLIGGRRPALVSLDAGDGDVRSCAAVPVTGTYGDVETVLTDQAGTDVVVAAVAPAAPVTLSRLGPSTGDVAWEHRLEGVGEAGSVTVVGNEVVVGRIGNDPVRLADMAAAGGIAGPMVRAYSLADGSPTWSYPEAEAAPETAAVVVGAEPGSDELVVLTAAPGRTRSSKATVARLVGLSGDGQPRWDSRLGTGYWSAASWGPDLVVAQGAGRHGGAQLRAFSSADGSFQWSLGSARLPSLGDRPRHNFGTATAFGDGFVVPSPNGLLLVDPGSGEAEQLDSAVAVDQVLRLGDHALVRTRDALLVLETVGPSV